MPPTTTPIPDFDNDDYVARVLASEARDNSLKYSAQGLEAYMPKRPSSRAPKPNTRFLRNIIRDTDSHNASLKRKEEREARERMRQLRDSTSTSASSRDHRRHRDLGRDRRDDRRERHTDRHRSHRRSHRSRSPDAERKRSRRHRRHESDESDEERRGSHRSRRSDRHERRRERSYSRSQSRSPRYDRSRHERHGRSSHRSVSPTRRSRSEKLRSEDDYTHHSRGYHSSKRSREYQSPPPESVLDNPSSPESDPLEDLVGPLPQKEAEESQAIRSRGRGAYKPNSSNIDSHFAEDYDPTLDVHLDDDGSTSTRPTRRPVAGLMTGDDDWELALEALRDRARWKQKGEERLREAGFNESIVERWKSNTAATRDGEGRLEDVKWSKRGEGREWDRGKFIDDEGRVDVKASWF